MKVDLSAPVKNDVNVADDMELMGMPFASVDKTGGTPAVTAQVGGAPAAVAFNDPGKIGGIALAGRRFAETAV